MSFFERAQLLNSAEPNLRSTFATWTRAFIPDCLIASHNVCDSSIPLLYKTAVLWCAVASYH